MHHVATGSRARGPQMSGLVWFNRVMDASFLHADLLFAAVIQGPKAEGQVKPRSRPPKEIWCSSTFFLQSKIWRVLKNWIWDRCEKLNMKLD